MAAIKAAGGKRAGRRARRSSELEGVDALADAALAAFGFVDIIVHNAGIASRGNTVVDTDPAELQRLMMTHTFSAARLCQRLLPQMRERGRGHVVMISSSARSPTCAPTARPYNMAKSALEALALTLAKEEIAHGIRVNIAAPGLVVTDMGAKLVQGHARRRGHDRARRGAAARAAWSAPRTWRASCASSCSPDADFVTGQRIVVDGGADASPTATRTAAASARA